MKPSASVVGSVAIHRGWAVIRQVEVDLRRSDGRQTTLQREVYDRGDSAAVLLLCRSRETAILTRQLRAPMLAIGEGDGFVTEVPAGLLQGKTPEETARSEACEETGRSPVSLHKALEVYSNPSVSTERVHLFVGEVATADELPCFAGVASEGEDIEVVEMPWKTLTECIASGAIKDSKTVLLVLYALTEGLLWSASSSACDRGQGLTNWPAGSGAFPAHTTPTPS